MILFIHEQAATKGQLRPAKLQSNQNSSLGERSYIFTIAFFQTPLGFHILISIFSTSTPSCFPSFLELSSPIKLIFILQLDRLGQESPCLIYG